MKKSQLVAVKKILVCGLASMSVNLNCPAQTYDTPELRRQRDSEKRKEDELRKQDELRRQQDLETVRRGFESKEAEAKSYVGKTFRYVPNPSAAKRIMFYESMPSSSYSQDPNILFTPLVTTTFVVTGAVMPPPVVYPEGQDRYLLEIRFADGKVGYVNVVGDWGIKENTYLGSDDESHEYVYVNNPDPATARLIADAEKGRRIAQEKAAQEKKELERKQTEEKRREQARYAERARMEKERRDAIAAQMAKPSPRIGMSKEQVINDTSWGRPSRTNRTITAAGTREQWVYDFGRYLYFDNGRLTAIQD